MHHCACQRCLLCAKMSKRTGMKRAAALNPADDARPAMRQEWLRLGHVVESPFSRFLPWSGYYMVAERPSVMRKYPSPHEYRYTYGDPLLFDGDPCAGGLPLPPAALTHPQQLKLTLMLHYATEPPYRSLGPWTLDVGDSQHSHYCSAFAWPEALYRILRRFPSRGLHTVLPVAASTFTDFPYTAEGTFRVLLPPAPPEATAVDPALHTILLGSGEEQTELPLLLDDSHTLDPACHVIQYFAQVHHAQLNRPVYHNFLLISDAVVQALLAADPRLVFFPIVIARGAALRNLCAQRLRIPTLTSYEEVAPPYDAIAEWRLAHLPHADSHPAEAENTLLRDKLYLSLCRACQSLAPKAPFARLHTLE